MVHFRRNTLLLWLYSVAALLAGCRNAGLPSFGPGKSDVDVAAQVRNLAALEHERDYGFYEFIYSLTPAGGDATPQVYRGRLLASESGAFKFEKAGKVSGARFWVHFHPQRELIVAFPDVKTAYRAEPGLLQDPELTSVIAAYDGIRMFLHLDEVWNSPDQVGMDEHETGGSVTLQKPGRPYSWKISLAPLGGNTPFSELQAGMGLNKVFLMKREKTAYKNFDESATERYFDRGEETGAQQMTFDIWEVELEGGSGTDQLQVTPYPSGSISRAEVESHLGPIELDKQFQVKELTVAQIKRWLNLR
jgi:hypothetical protein